MSPRRFEQAVDVRRTRRSRRSRRSRAMSSAGRISWLVAPRSSRAASWPPSREIKELRERVADAIDSCWRNWRPRSPALDATHRRRPPSAIGALAGRAARQEKAIVGHDAQLARAPQKTHCACRASRARWRCERRQRRRGTSRARDPPRRTREASMARLAEAAASRRRASSVEAQRRLADARETVELARHACGAKRVRRTPRSSNVRRPLGAEVLRLEEGARELEVSDREQHRRATADATAGAKRSSQPIASSEQARSTRTSSRSSRCAARRARRPTTPPPHCASTVDAQDAAIRRGPRARSKKIRAEASENTRCHGRRPKAILTHPRAGVCRRRPEHPSTRCSRQVEEMERSGQATPDAAAISAEEPDPEVDEEEHCRFR